MAHVLRFAFQGLADFGEGTPVSAPVDVSQKAARKLLEGR
jgi:hypothetical protein